MNIKSIPSTLPRDHMFKSNVQKLTAALTLGVLSICFAPAAAAISTYDASAGLTITLDSVIDVDGNAVDAAGNWAVTAEGFEDQTLTDVFGAATVSVTNTIAPLTSLGVGGSVNQASNSSGSATNGSSSADTLTSLEIFVENTFTGSLNFNFSFSASVDATIAGGTTANDFAGSAVSVFDDLGFDYIDIFTDVSIDGTDAIPLTGTFGFTLLDADVNTVIGFVDSYGQTAATAPPIPVPAAVWLFGSGLLGLVGVARRKK